MLYTPKKVEVIKEEEYSTRMDLRSKRTFTIDSKETRIRDDAIHVEMIDKETIETIICDINNWNYILHDSCNYSITR